MRAHPSTESMVQGHFEQETGDVWPRKRPLPAALMFPCSVCPIWQLPLFGGSAISMYTIRGNTAERELALTAIRVGAVSALNDVLLSAASGRGAMDLTPCAGVLINLLSADPHGTEMQAAFRKAGVLNTTLTVLRRQPDCALAKELLMEWVRAIMPPDVDQEHARGAVAVEEIRVATEAAGFKGALLEKLFA